MPDLRRGACAVGLGPAPSRAWGRIAAAAAGPVPGMSGHACAAAGHGAAATGGAVEVIGAALTARAAGLGHRRIAVWLGAPASTVRGWLRRWAARVAEVRVHFMVVARLAGVDQAVPKALGSKTHE